MDTFPSEQVCVRMGSRENGKAGQEQGRFAIPGIGRKLVSDLLSRIVLDAAAFEYHTRVVIRNCRYILHYPELP